MSTGDIPWCEQHGVPAYRCEAFAHGTHGKDVMLPSASRRLKLADEIAKRLEVLDPLMVGLSGVQITVRLREDGSVRVIVVEPEMRYEGGQ